MTAPQTLELELSRIQSFFATWVDTHGHQGAVGEAAQWLATSDLDPRDFHAIERRYGAGHEEWLRTGVPIWCSSIPPSAPQYRNSIRRR